MNTVTIRDRYPLPNIADFTLRVQVLTVFSKLDLQKGYQVPRPLQDICKTTIITRFFTHTNNLPIKLTFMFKQ